jgi:hypothetical protein
VDEVFVLLSRVLVIIDGVWLGDSVYWPFTHTHTRLVSKSNYNAIANLHNSQITTNAKPFQPAVSSQAVPWQRLLTLTPAYYCLNRLPYRTHYPELSSKHCFAYNLSARTAQKTQLFHCYSLTIGILRICCPTTGTNLLSHCLAMAVVYRITA